MKYDIEDPHFLKDQQSTWHMSLTYSPESTLTFFKGRQGLPPPAGKLKQA
jgi:hypothetical protein